ncbi:hypothetical protein GCM10027565_48740 [Bordetella tumulicola]
MRTPYDNEKLRWLTERLSVANRAAWDLLASDALMNLPSYYLCRTIPKLIDRPYPPDF